MPSAPGGAVSAPSSDALTGAKGGLIPDQITGVGGVSGDLLSQILTVLADLVAAITALVQQLAGDALPAKGGAVDGADGSSVDQMDGCNMGGMVPTQVDQTDVDGSFDDLLPPDNVDQIDKGGKGGGVDQTGKGKYPGVTHAGWYHKVDGQWEAFSNRPGGVHFVSDGSGGFRIDKRFRGSGMPPLPPPPSPKPHPAAMVVDEYRDHNGKYYVYAAGKLVTSVSNKATAPTRAAIAKALKVNSVAINNHGGPETVVIKSYNRKLDVATTADGKVLKFSDVKAANANHGDDLFYDMSNAVIDTGPHEIVQK